MVDTAAKKSFSPRRTLFRLAWLLLAISLFIPAPPGVPVEVPLGISALYVYGKAIAWSHAVPGTPGSLTFPQAAILALALYTHIAFIYTWYLRDEGGISAAWKALLVAALVIDTGVALLVPELARLAAYWVWLSSIAALAAGFVLFGGSSESASAKSRKDRSVIDRGEVPPFVWAVLCLTLFWVAVSAADHAFSPKDRAEANIVEPLTGYVNDRAGLLKAGEQSALTFALQKFEAATPSQLAIAIYPHKPADSSIEEFTIDAAEHLPLGAKGLDTGALLFLFMGERVARLEVGYGLEGVLTDADSHRILEEKLAPAFSRGAYFDGLDASLKSVFAKVEEAAKHDLLPGRLAVWKRKLRADQPWSIRQFWRTVSGTGLLARIGTAFLGAIVGIIFWSTLPNWLRLARDIRRGVDNRRAGRPLREGMETFDPDAIEASVRFVFWTLGALAPTVGVIIIAGGGAFGGAGAMIHW